MEALTERRDLDDLLQRIVCSTANSEGALTGDEKSSCFQPTNGADDCVLLGASLLNSPNLHMAGAIDECEKLALKLTHFVQCVKEILSFVEVAGDWWSNVCLR